MTRRTLLGSFAAVLSVLASGCGSNSITGGSLPPGPNRLAGTAAKATAPDQPVAGAQVVVTDASGAERRATTDASGQFTIAEAAAGPAQVQVTAAGMHTLSLGVELPQAGMVTVALAMVPSDVTVDVQSLVPNPPSIQARIGDRVHVSATPMVGPMHTTSVTPSWVVEGGVGGITHSGMGMAVFQAARTGAGRIVISLGSQQAVVPIEVSP
ncbi:MAG: carboxypeptidase regulatory-like domain-containing protein [Armatimonadetes bacterium]|nr:carboxypeptidase regulatory-like domain-containing protein [Armatimonadota bacterium]